ncbi:hypothetical protein OH76DRAFT_1412399, partial [Lentinus brumalis]
TETGIWPLRYRRASLGLRYLRYVLRDEPTLALAAVREAWTLAQHGHSSWWSDLCHSLVTLPEPVAIALDARPTPDMVKGLLKDVEHSLAQHLYKSVRDSRRLPLLWARFVAFHPPRHCRRSAQRSHTSSSRAPSPARLSYGSLRRTIPLGLRLDDVGRHLSHPTAASVASVGRRRLLKTRCMSSLRVRMPNCSRSARRNSYSCCSLSSRVPESSLGASNP